MKQIIPPLFFLLFIASIAYGQQPPAAPDGAPAQSQANPVAEGNTAFALDLYAELATVKGNLFFSPYSISTAMGMVWSGARANTAKEIKDTLHFGVGQNKLPAAIQSLTTGMQADAAKAGLKFRIANALCITGGAPSDD
jgi:serpin B